MHLDFAMGASVFLLSLFFVFMFVPGIVEPFTETGQEDTVAANNVADRLSRGLLGDSDTPYVLDRVCTVDFFSGVTNDNCRYDGSTLQEQLGLGSQQNVNVSLKGNVTGGANDGTDVLYWDEASESLKEVDEPDGYEPSNSNHVRLSAGKTPPTGSGTSVTTRRVVTINGTDATLLVEMW